MKRSRPWPSCLARACLAASVVAGPAACTGSIEPDRLDTRDPLGSPGDPGAGAKDGKPGLGGPGPSQPGPAAPAAAGTTAGVLPLRPLTELEYRNTVRDLLGVDPTGLVDLAHDERGSAGFAEAIAGSEVAVDRYHTSAAKLAAAALKDPQRLLPCGLDAANETCIGAFIEQFGRRAFRRPLSNEQRGAFMAWNRKLAADPEVRPADRVRMLLEAFLTSPEFLYRGPHLDAKTTPGRVVALDAWELASRLSYALQASMPDEPLFAAAAAGTLANTPELERQVRRLLSSERAFPAFRTFVEHWLELEEFDRIDKDTKAFPSFSDALKTSMRGEFDRFVREALLMGDGKLSTLLLAKHSYIDGALAKLYGVAGTPTPTASTTLDPQQRAGLLTQAAFLNVHASKVDSHPIKRGKIVFSQILCGTMPPAPTEIPTPKPPAPNVTTRERYAEHGNAACAKGCHQLLDPLGFAFEHYDALGAYRTTEAGKPVDASGEAILPSGGKHRFTNAVELMGILARSEDVRRCVATQWFRFALGRLDVPDDKASIEEAGAAFARAGDDLRELVVAAIRSPAFRYRLVPATEVSR